VEAAFSIFGDDPYVVEIPYVNAAGNVINYPGGDARATEATDAIRLAITESVMLFLAPNNLTGSRVEYVAGTDSFVLVLEKTGLPTAIQTTRALTVRLNSQQVVDRALTLLLADLDGDAVDIPSGTNAAAQAGLATIAVNAMLVELGFTGETAVEALVVPAGTGFTVTINRFDASSDTVAILVEVDPDLTEPDVGDYIGDDSDLVMSGGFLIGVEGMTGTDLNGEFDLPTGWTVEVEGAGTGGIIVTGSKVIIKNAAGVEVASSIVVIKGDITGTGTVGLGDAVRLVNHLRGSAPLAAASPFFAAADLDNNGSVGLGDAVLLVNILRA
jgi:hypothetical protein